MVWRKLPGLMTGSQNGNLFRKGLNILLAKKNDRPVGENMPGGL